MMSLAVQSEVRQARRAAAAPAFAPQGLPASGGRLGELTALLNRGPHARSLARLGAAVQRQPGAAAIQRVIGDAGKANVGRLVLNKDWVMAQIVGLEKPKYMGRTWSPEPTVYHLSFFHDKSSGYALGNDPNYWLVKKEDEAAYVEKHGKRTGTLIPVRGPVLQDLASGEYVRDEKTDEIKPASGGKYKDGTYPFVILADGSLRIADDPLVGHTGLAKGHAVMMAGELMISDGKATYHSSQTGHYHTTPAEEVRGVAYMKEKYPWIADLKPKGWEKKGLAALFGAVTPAPETTIETNFLVAQDLWETHGRKIWVVDVLMQTMAKFASASVELQKESGNAEKIKPQLEAEARRTSDVLRDIKEAIVEHARGEGREEKRPQGLAGYDGTDPYAF